MGYAEELDSFLLPCYDIHFVSTKTSLEPSLARALQGTPNLVLGALPVREARRTFCCGDSRYRSSNPTGPMHKRSSMKRRIVSRAAL